MHMYKKVYEPIKKSYKKCTLIVFFIPNDQGGSDIIHICICMLVYLRQFELSLLSKILKRIDNRSRPYHHTAIR